MGKKRNNFIFSDSVRRMGTEYATFSHPEFSGTTSFNPLSARLPLIELSKTADTNPPTNGEVLSTVTKILFSVSNRVATLSGVTQRGRANPQNNENPKMNKFRLD